MSFGPGPFDVWPPRPLYKNARANSQPPSVRSPRHCFAAALSSFLHEGPQPFTRLMASGTRRELFAADGMNSAVGLRSTTSTAIKMKRFVRVRPKAVLSAVVAEAGLPEVKYNTYMTNRGRMAAAVYFWPSELRSEHMTIHGEPAVDASEAIQNAATRCLEYLQNTMTVEFDCPQIQKIKTDMKYLSSSVCEKDRQIKDLKTKVEKKDLQVMSLSKGWESFADDVLDSAGRIDKVAVNYLPSGSSPVIGDMTWDCYGLTQEADNLEYLSMMSTDAINTLRGHTYDDESDCSEYRKFCGYYPSDHEDNSGGYSSEFELW